MDIKKVKKTAILITLFFLPVIFLLFLYPSTNNYTPLNIVKENVLDVQNLTSYANSDIVLEDHISVIAFLGTDPELKIKQMSNLRELIYDKFQGFKKFQVVILVSKGSEDGAYRLKQELNKYNELKYWHFVFVDNDDSQKLFNNLRSTLSLDSNYASDYVFIVDKDLNQRGRLDDRTDKEIEKNDLVYPLTAYNCTKVAILKNKMGADDLRVLFTEYRQKRKGEFDSSTRRANQIKPDYEKEN
ncbi:hypothetical protein ES677_10930 [Bizionia gelidisalsuginis]|uniref:Uncharacterized protein n=1 Tax=Bizionia gelidisalsuginis TaxID=291188 RepID=A0ABY3M8Y4_9FLAO|nr:hypothetical protein [Bizionia gelidisalsuginis]TYC10698.1 hypothetical protein ES677_10930 [Bizionia gelidisalsuginis]